MMPTSFFEHFPAKEDLAKHLASLPEGHSFHGLSATEFVRAELPKESKFQEKIEKEFEKWKKTYMIAPSSRIYKKGASVYNSNNGFPDLLIISEGKFIAFEVKRPYLGQTSRLQDKAIEEINAAGGFAGVGSYPSELQALLEKAGAWWGGDPDSDSRRP